MRGPGRPSACLSVIPLSVRNSQAAVDDDDQEQKLGFDRHEPSLHAATAASDVRRAGPPYSE